MAKKKSAGKGGKKKDRTIYPLGKLSAEAAPMANPAVFGETGLQAFSFHSADSALEARDLLPAHAFADAGAEPELSHLNPEAAARYYLQGTLASPALPSFTVKEVNAESPEFKSLGAEKLPLTDTQTVKFRQMYHKIPVYGSLVTIELDDNNKLVSINSSMGDPVNVDPVASISPAEALAKVKELAGYSSMPLNANPRLFYYYEQSQSRWRLVYIFEDVLKRSPDGPADNAPGEHAHDSLPPVVDYVLDAHSNELIKEIPRVLTAAITEQATDGLNKSRTITAFQQDGPPVSKQLHDPALNVITHDFEFRSIRFQFAALPGKVIVNPPTPWDGGAISAHANAAVVATFLKKILLRNGLDNQGGALRSSINCLDAVRPDRVWRNAAWFLGQMVYGQRRVGNTFRSFALALDVVAHEIFHGVTDHTARLEYAAISGALNESYSDIFGAIVSNFEEDDIDNWNWEMGEDLDGTGNPLRDMERPSRFGQPEHMDQFRIANPPFNRENDFGHVHTNSGIHNLAAFRLITAKDAEGKHLFDKTSVAVLFYVALTQHLSRLSTFSDSRRAIELVARTLFRNAPSDARQAKLKAVRDAFESVGIPVG